MPNIEIHGFVENNAKKLREDIFELFNSKSYVKEMVVTVFSTIVRDANNVSQPFIRLVNSCQEHTDEILNLLSSFDFDIEHLELKEFYSRGELPKKLK